MHGQVRVKDGTVNNAITAHTTVFIFIDNQRNRLISVSVETLYAIKPSALHLDWIFRTFLMMRCQFKV
jgi:hypothetical protein